MQKHQIYSINYWEQFVLNKFNVLRGEEPFGIVLPDSVAQRVREHPYLNNHQQQFCSYPESREDLYMTPHGVIAVTRAPRHNDRLVPSFRIFSMQRHNVVHLAVDVTLPFDSDKVICSEGHFE